MFNWRNVYQTDFILGRFGNVFQFNESWHKYGCGHFGSRFLPFPKGLAYAKIVSRHSNVHTILQIGLLLRKLKMLHHLFIKNNLPYANFLLHHWDTWLFVKKELLLKVMDVITSVKLLPMVRTFVQKTLGYGRLERHTFVGHRRWIRNDQLKHWGYTSILTSLRCKFSWVWPLCGGRNNPTLAILIFESNEIWNVTSRSEAWIFPPRKGEMWTPVEYGIELSSRCTYFALSVHSLV